MGHESNLNEDSGRNELNNMPYVSDCAVSLVRKNTILIFSTIVVLTFQLVFRATLIARHLNY
jgi:hypothetical protein